MKHIRTVLLSLTMPMVAIALTLPTSNVEAAELLMLEQKGCVWCKRWHEEIGEAYPNTEEGRRAPLRVIDIHKPWPEDLAGIQSDRITPTFVLIEDHQEVARLRGYPGDHFFWPMLENMLSRLPNAD